MKKAAWFLQFMLVSAASFAQIKGRVVDKKTHLPIDSTRAKQLDEVTVAMSKEQAAANKVRRNVMPVTILTAKQMENRAANLIM